MDLEDTSNQSIAHGVETCHHCLCREWEVSSRHPLALGFSPRKGLAREDGA